jgi:ELP3 family radical SAM enzyme/protein acetyltransferase
MKVSSRSWSGVLPISVALDGNTFSCKYNCSFCPNECIENGASVNISRSYLSSEGTFLRGALSNFDAYLQIIRRLLELENMGHFPDKLEIIILGGTWDCYDMEYRKDFIHSIYYACNVYPFFSKYFGKELRNITEEWLSQNPFQNKLELTEDFILKARPQFSFEKEKSLNERSQGSRIIGIVIETRPDQICLSNIIEKRRLGCTRIQLGIQHTDNDILEKNNRGHSIEASIKAIRKLKNNGFKVDGHIMPDLPFTTIKKDYEMVDKIFLTDEFQLDYVKIYPCLDLPYTQSRKWKEEQIWTPYAETNYNEFVEFLAYTLSIVPPWTRVNRVHRDFPMASQKNNGLGYESDTIKTNLNQLIHQYLEKTGRQCYDIRNREIKNQKWDKTLLNKSKLYIRKYQQENAMEYFISVEIPKSTDIFDDSILLGFIRLRILKTDSKECIPSIKKHKIARIRELHVYGFISKTNTKNSIQHLGIGKFLISIAESISYLNGCTKISIISGVGVRQYYAKLGYSLKKNDPGEYMFKSINKMHVYTSLFGKYIYIPYLLNWQLLNTKSYSNIKNCFAIGYKYQPIHIYTLFFILFFLFFIPFSLNYHSHY